MNGALFAPPAPFFASPAPATHTRGGASPRRRKPASSSSPASANWICSSQCEIKTGGRITSVAGESQIRSRSASGPSRSSASASSRDATSNATGPGSSSSASSPSRAPLDAGTGGGIHVQCFRPSHAALFASGTRPRARSTNAASSAFFPGSKRHLGRRRGSASVTGAAPPRFMRMKSHVSSAAAATAARARRVAATKCAQLRLETAASDAARRADARTAESERRGRARRPDAAVVVSGGGSGLTPGNGDDTPPGGERTGDPPSALASFDPFASSAPRVPSSAFGVPSEDGGAGGPELLRLRFGFTNSYAARSIAAKCPVGVAERRRVLFFLAAAADDDGYFALADPGVRAAKAPSFVPSAGSSSPPVDPHSRSRSDPTPRAARRGLREARRRELPASAPSLRGLRPGGGSGRAPRVARRARAPSPSSRARARRTVTLPGRPRTPAAARSTARRSERRASTVEAAPT